MNTEHPAHRAPCGFTLPEVAIAIAVLSVITTAAVPSLARFVESQRLRGVAAELASDLQFTRAEAVARNEALRISFSSASPGCYVIHTGAAQACSCELAPPGHCAPGAQHLKTVALSAERSIRLSANVSSILFDPLHGTATPASTLRLIGAHAQAIHHVVNLMGRVRTCSPQAAVPGQPAC